MDDHWRIIEDVKRLTGGRMAERVIGGRQCTVEGYVHDGEVVPYGVVDSIRYPQGRRLFLRRLRLGQTQRQRQARRRRRTKARRSHEGVKLQHIHQISRSRRRRQTQPARRQRGMGDQHRRADLVVVAPATASLTGRTELVIYVPRS